MQMNLPMMYCNFNMFDVNSQVILLKEGEESYPIFSGNFEDVCSFIATEYNSKPYEKVVLSGPYADTLSVRIRAYNRANFNFDDIKIEVLN